MVTVGWIPLDHIIQSFPLAVAECIAETVPRAWVATRTWISWRPDRVALWPYVNFFRFCRADTEGCTTAMG
jgi:hypothetical protein